MQVMVNEKECCLTCKHYSFENESMQICNNINNHQLNNDNEFNEDRWYKMMVTPNFLCIEWEVHNDTNKY